MVHVDLFYRKRNSMILREEIVMKKLIVMLILSLSLSIPVGAEEELDEIYVPIWDVYNEIVQRIKDNAEIIYSGTIEENDLLNIVYLDIVPPDDSFEIESYDTAFVDETLARDMFFYKHGEEYGVIGCEIGETLEVTTIESDIPLYMVIGYARRTLGYTDKAAAVLSEGMLSGYDVL